MKRVLLFLLLVPFVCAYDISDWPYFFVSDGQFDALYVLGEEAPSLDVVSAMIVSSSLAKLNISTAVGTSRIDKEIPDVSVKNAVVIGSPCENRAAFQLMGRPEPCYKDLAGSAGFIKLYEQNGKVQLLITGFDEKDRHAAAKFLAESDLNAVRFTEFVVNSDSGSVPLYFANKVYINESSNESLSNTSDDSLNATVNDTVEAVNQTVIRENVSVQEFGPYEPLEELPEKKGFWAGLWAWFASLFS